MDPPPGYRGPRGGWPRWIHQQSTATADRGHHPRWGELHRAIMVITGHSPRGWLGACGESRAPWQVGLRGHSSHPFLGDAGDPLRGGCWVCQEEFEREKAKVLAAW